MSLLENRNSCCMSCQTTCCVLRIVQDFAAHPGRPNRPLRSIPSALRQMRTRLKVSLFSKWPMWTERGISLNISRLERPLIGKKWYLRRVLYHSASYHKCWRTYMRKGRIHTRARIKYSANSQSAMITYTLQQPWTARENVHTREPGNEVILWWTFRIKEYCVQCENKSRSLNQTEQSWVYTYTRKGRIHRRAYNAYMSCWICRQHQGGGNYNCMHTVQQP